MDTCEPERVAVQKPYVTIGMLARRSIHRTGRLACKSVYCVLRGWSGGYRGRRGCAIRVAGHARDEVDVIWTIRFQISRVKRGDIRVFRVDRGMAIGAGLFCIQAHFSPLLKVAGSALQSLVYRALQVTAVIGPWLVAFFAQLGSIFYGDVCLGGRVIKRQFFEGFAGRVMTGFAFDGLPGRCVFVHYLPGACLIHRLHEVADVVGHRLERCVALNTFIRKQFFGIMYLIGEYICRTGGMQRIRPTLVFLLMTNGAICTCHMRIRGSCRTWRDGSIRRGTSCRRRKRSGRRGSGVLVGGTEVVGTAVGAGVADVAQADTKTQTSTELNIRKITFFVFILEHSPLILKGSEIFDSQ